MSTPTPTAELPVQATPPIGEQALAQLANALFAALPGQSGEAIAALAGHRPDQPEALHPALAPTSTPGTHTGITTATGAGSPHPSAIPAPGINGTLLQPDAVALGRGGIGYLDHAGPHAIPAPRVDHPYSPTSSTPYYFQKEGGWPVPAAGAPLPSLLPGVPELEREAPRSTAPSPYYFVDAQQPGTPAASSVPVTHPAASPGIIPSPAISPATTPAATSHNHGTLGAYELHALRRDFPILQETVNGKPLIWLDNAATTHKPQAVIDRLAWFYAHENSNIHRAAHALAARATDAYEAAREKAARFLGAASPDEIVFVRGATEGINLLARTWGAQQVGEGDEIIVSHLEHHANIVPWQQLAADKGARLRVIPVDDDGQVRLDAFRALLSPRTKVVSVTQVSNALGTVVPVDAIIRIAHAAGVKVIVDGAQSVAHMRVNVQALDADFFVFSGHKVFGPTGIGVVYGKKALLDSLPPWQGGGNMIADVTFEHTQYQPAPARFEAGTGNIADAVGLGAAFDYLDRYGIDTLGAYEHGLLEYATAGLSTIPGLRLIGTAAHKASVLSFVLEGLSTQEVGVALNREGIAVRSGHHCAQPILRRFGVESTVRPSLAFYNTREEIDTLVQALQNLKR
ncbi:SufS family cysteine desulfurase [Alcaligenaceae bacterium SJ-26]|nr:SufS family cysteine desulfurase [Alcaligenaceae bacterium SJ-26]